MTCSASGDASSPSSGNQNRVEILKRFVVRFQDWTNYRLEIIARDEDHALELVKAMSQAELWETGAIDGDQENWQVSPMSEHAEGAP